MSLFARGPFIAENAASSVFVFAVYHALRYVVFEIGTNPTRYQEIIFDIFDEAKNACCCCIFGTRTAGSSGSDAVVAVHVVYIQEVRVPYLVSARTTS